MRQLHGITLIECIVYMAIFVTLMGISTMAFYQCFDNMKALRRNADDIAHALHAGELWRDDVRNATGPIQIEKSTRIARIPHRQGDVFYKFAEAQVFRKVGPDASWVVLLPKVKRSQMTADTRKCVVAWRWELELQPSLNRTVHVQPVFSFLAAPHAANQP
jgi:hypothetical protein